MNGRTPAKAINTFGEDDGFRGHLRGEPPLDRRNPWVDVFHVLRRRVMIGVMSSGRGETAQQWYERAIVAASIAAAQEELLAEAGNPIAKRVARKRVEEAAGDLQQALIALKSERRQVS